MNMDGTGMGPLVSTASSVGVWKPAADRIPDQFPAGLRILVVDDDPICLTILEKMLTKCMYEVTTCSKAVVALSMLRQKKDGFDLVLSDVYMPDMDGFKLLEHIGLEMDLPVIMMSSDDKKEVVMKGVTHGACDYLIKPVRIEAIKNIWQHVVRKRRNEYKDFEHSGNIEDTDKLKKTSEDGDFSSSIDEGSSRNSKRRKDIKDEEDEGEEREDSSALKKPRVVWSVELHQQFVSAVNQLGIDKAVPKKILELMNIPGITRENVASHLQKYRLYLRRLSGVSQNQVGLSNSFVAPSDVNFSSVTSFDELDLQALAVSGHLPQQNFATLQSDIGRAVIATSIGVSLAEQMNLFNPSQTVDHSPKLRFGIPQVDNKQQNLPQSLPTSFGPKQLTQMHHAVVNPFGSVDLQGIEGLGGFVNLPMQIAGQSSHIESTHLSRSQLIQMTPQNKQHPVVQNTNQILSNMVGQPRLRGQFPNETIGGHVSNFSSPMEDQMISHGTICRIPGKNSPILNRRSMSSGSSYITTAQAASVGFPITHGTELPGSEITCRGGLFPTATPSSGSLEELRNEAHLKDTGPFTSYDVLKGQNITFATQNTSLPLNPDFLVGHHGLGGPQKSRDSRAKYGNQGIFQSEGNMSVETPFIVKTEASTDLCHESMPINEHIVDDYPLNAFFEQEEDGGIIDPEFNFDGFPMDNILV